MYFGQIRNELEMTLIFVEILNLLTSTQKSKFSELRAGSDHSHLLIWEQFALYGRKSFPNCNKKDGRSI